MKTNLLTLIGILTSSVVLGQIPDTTNDVNIKNKILSDIRVTQVRKSKTLDSTASTIDLRLKDIDSIINISKRVSIRADKLFERVQTLEERLAIVEENDLIIYQTNYQSAIINLVSIDREIKPLILFNSTRDFFNALTETSNPMNYPEYSKWYEQFNKYIENNKNGSAGLNVLSNLINLTGDLTKGTPFTGPIIQPLFSGIATFIGSLNDKQKAMREQSQIMFLLTAKVAQFAHDRDLIESGWTNITKELKELQIHFDTILDSNLILLKIPENEYNSNFAKQNDAFKRYQYMKLLSQKSIDLVSQKQKENPKDWKEVIFNQLMDVQSLKLRFGKITFDISENIRRYRELIVKYKNDPQIGFKIQSLDSKLNELKDTFDKAFEPSEYINSAARMYKPN